MNSSSTQRKETVGALRNPLAVYGLVILVLESIVAVVASLSFKDNPELLFWLLVLLILGMLFVVSIFSYIVLRAPRNLTGKFEEAIQLILRELSEADKRVLMDMGQAGGRLEYTEETKERYKELRNQGLVRTESRSSMRKDHTLVLTPIGSLVVEDLQRSGRARR